jgi:hypothetical protein
MKRVILATSLFFNLLVFYSCAQSPSWVWSKSSIGTGDEMITCSITDAGSNTYIGGTFKSPTVQFGSFLLNNYNSPSEDGFIVKYNSSGAVVWAREISGSGSDIITSICLVSGEVWVAGSTTSTSLTSGSDYIGGGGSGFSEATLIVRLTTTGNFSSSAGYDSYYDESIACMVSDPSGNIYIAGMYSGTVNFGPSPITSVSASKDVFVVKYNSSGLPEWTISIGGSGSEYPRALTVDASGNVTVTGIFESDTLKCGAMKQENDLPGVPDLFVCRLFSSGSANWINSPTGNFPNDDYDLCSDNNGMIYLTGSFNDSSVSFDSFVLNNVDTNSATSDMFLARYDTSGSVDWATSAGGIGNDMSRGIGYISGNLYLSGHFAGDTILFPSVILTNSNTDNTEDIFVCKYDTIGNNVWAVKTGGSGRDFATDISVSTPTRLFVSGQFDSPSLTFGSTAPLSNTSAGTLATFIARLNTPLPTSISEQEKLHIKCYPNPSNGNINFDGLEIGSLIRILDGTGKLICEKDVSGVFISIDMVRFSSGIYFFQIINERDEIIAGKFILN